MDKEIKSPQQLEDENATIRKGRKIAVVVLIGAAVICLAIAKCAGRF